MFRTPAKASTDTSAVTTPPKNLTISKGQTNVRRSIGEWEAGRVLFPEETLTAPVRSDRLHDARAWVAKAKSALNASRNLKTDIKASVTQAIDGLYQIVKEAETGKPACAPLPVLQCAGMGERTGEPEPEPKTQGTETPGKPEISELLSSLAEHSRLMRESNERAEQLKEALQEKRESLSVVTYASVAATEKGRKRPAPTALHSMVITSRDEMETGEDVLGRIRKAVNAKESSVQIDRVRKTKDRKIVIGCRSEKERDRVERRIKTADHQLEVQMVKNQDPLIILREVMSFHQNDEILGFLRTQNKPLFRDLPADEDRMEVKFRKGARNSLTCHVVLKVSPTLWARFLEASEVYIDLQHIGAYDQSPLVQCSMCLGYGHTRRLCTETMEKCGYCGGPHGRKECTVKLAGAHPTCCNCISAKLESTGHTAFSTECPVRRKWDALARAKTAYC